MVTAQVPGSSAAAYTYDPSGQRVRQTVGSDTTHYLWDELSAYGDVVRETNGTGTELASYTLADTQLLGQTRSGVTSYYLSDGQGSTRALLNGTGDLTDTYDYTAFGEIYNQTGSTLNNYRYTGQQFDSLTGLYSLRARYYDPGVGRFVSRDTYPINYRYPSQLNRYGYVGNNPINRYDPTGHFSIVETVKSVVATLTQGYVVLSAIGGAVTAMIGSYLTYLGAASGSCGEGARQWATHVDPLKFIGLSAGLGFVFGGAFAISPTVEAAVAVGSVVATEVAIATQPEQVVEDVQLSWCFFSQALLTIANELLIENENQWYDDIRVTLGVTAVAKAAVVGSLGWGATVSRGAVNLSLKGVGIFAAGVYAVIAAGLATFPQPPKCFHRNGRFCRTEDEYDDLARDYAKGGNTDSKSEYERRIALELERNEQLEGPITRYHGRGADYVDANGQEWDIKSFNSHWPDSFDLGTVTRDIGEEIRGGEYIIIDTTDMIPSDIQALRTAVANKAEWNDKIIWFP